MVNKQTSDDLIGKIKQNYQSIILGVLVILIGVSVLLKASNTGKKTETAAEKAAQKMEETVVSPGQTYMVQKGDTLWSISEKTYKTGYAWRDVAKANKLTNPNNIEAGQSLAMPTVDVKKYTAMMLPKALPKVEKAIESKPAVSAAQTSQVTIKGASYTVVAGDHLWGIAVRAYGDGYAWSKIWKANSAKIKNPNLIYPGTVLNLPR